MTISILAQDYYLPSKILSNSDLEQEFPGWSAAKIEKKIGIRERRIAENETALDMAEKACKKLFEHYDPSQIDFILFCTQSPEYKLPTTACILQERLKLPITIGALDYNLGCSGFIYGLSLCKGLIAGNMAKQVLLITSETYSKYIHPKDRALKALFGDAAAACVIGESSAGAILEFVFGTDGSGATNLMIPNGGSRNEYQQNAFPVEYQLGSMNDCNHLFMNGPEIFNFTIQRIPVLVQELLKKNNLRLDEIDYFLFHQANSYMLNFLCKILSIPPDKFLIDMLETGNTVSASIPLLWSRLREQGKIKKPAKIMLVGFGVGYSFAGTVIHIK